MEVEALVEVAVAAGPFAARKPKSPSAWPFGPAVKYMALGFVTPIAPPPTTNDHNPSILIGLPLESSSWPRKAEVVGLNALIVPLPKLPLTHAVSHSTSTDTVC